jgi:rhomboid protease GluP
VSNFSNDNQRFGDTPPSYNDAGFSNPETRQDDHRRRLAEFYQTLFHLTPSVFVTPAIAGLNIVIFLAMVAWGANFFWPGGENMIAWGANYGPKTANGQWWRLLTSTFLHFGIIHLALNMWVLWDAGKLVERLVGNVGFLLMYLISGVAGSLTSVYWNPHVVSAGASGAVFGVFGALLGFLIWRRDTIPMETFQGIRNSALTFLAYNLIFGLQVKGIDMAAHVGGLVAGFVCGTAMSQRLTLAEIDDAAAGRWTRNILVAVGGAGFIALAIWQMPAGPIDIMAEQVRMAAVQKKASDVYHEAALRHQNGNLSDVEFAEIVERDVLPPWRDAHAVLLRVKNERGVDQERVATLAEAMKLREESWQSLVEGLRSQDQSKFQTHRDKWEAADSLLENLDAGDPGQ